MGSGGIVYLPFVSGILSSAYRADKNLRDNYTTKPFLFRPSTLDQIIAEYENPSVATFSISMWNEQLSLEVAAEVKRRWPDTLIIFGGAQCPHHPVDYMKKYDFIDICVRAEGEEAFVKILQAKLFGLSFENIPNTTYRLNQQIFTNKNASKYEKSLDVYPSPYLTGEFDYLLKKPDHNLQAIVETNRGCPFLCTFCYWGKGGSTTKYRFRSLETVFAELEYLAKHKVGYVFNADSNFGMHRRDFEIALKLIECKEKYGFPEKFRTCWGKNTSERIFKIASMLQYHDLDKGVTLARQSNSTEVLKNIKRDNIKLESYTELEKRFNELQVPVYAELILGLPGETVDSWLDGIEQMLEAGLNNQLFIYQAEVYPNTELADKTYREKHKIKTQKIKLNEIHCSPRPEGWVNEYQEIVVGNYSQTTDDWKLMTSISTMTMLFHSMKAGIYILSFLRNHCGLTYKQILSAIMESHTPIIRELLDINDKYTDALLRGEGRGIYIPEKSDVYLDIEEVQLLSLIDRRSEFYEEVNSIFLNHIPKKHKSFWRELLLFHEVSMPRYRQKTSVNDVRFETNVPEYCAKLFTSFKLNPASRPMTVSFVEPGYKTFKEFVQKQIIWARKSGLIMYKCDYEKQFLASIRKEFEIENIRDEKEIKISVLPSDRERFESFSAFN